MSSGQFSRALASARSAEPSSGKRSFTFGVNIMKGIGRDELLALGLIALCYGAALQLHGYGFLAVFTAGLTLRSVERKHTGKEPPPEELAVEAALKPDEIATHPEKGPAHMAGAILTINEQLERVVEIALVLVVAAALSPQYLHFEATWFIAILFLVIRPVSVSLGLLGQKMPASERSPHLLVWHPGDWITLLPDVCAQSRITTGSDITTDLHYADHHCHFHRRAWNYGDAAHELAPKASKKTNLSPHESDS